MRQVFLELKKDEENLRFLQENQTKAAGDQYDHEITILTNQLEMQANNASKAVRDLREQHSGTDGQLR